MSGQRTIPECNVSIYRNGPEILAVLAGALRMQNGDLVKQKMLDLMVEGVQNIYLHLSRLMEVDSAGLGVLVGLHITSRKRKINFALVAPTNFQMKLFETTRLNSVFSLIDGIEAVDIWNKLARDENLVPLPDGPSNPA
jgi:anti-anti-sigma factor